VSIPVLALELLSLGFSYISTNLNPHEVRLVIMNFTVLFTPLSLYYYDHIQRNTAEESRLGGLF
jgi:hypothetical protein